MATKLIITPNTTSISATSNTTTLTISSAVGGAASDASGVAFSGAVSGFDGANNSVKDALNYLANNFFVQTTAPTAGTTNLAEGAVSYTHLTLPTN